MKEKKENEVKPKPLVLIVDDKPNNIKLICDTLKEENYEFAFATNGTQALEFVSGGLPDLILLDIAMPGLDGFEVCKRLKASPETKDIPIIFLTRFDEPENIVKGFDVGALDYVTRPFRGQELIARVRTHIELKKSQDTIMEQNKELKDLNATKDKFFKIIAHDLKNPFGILLQDSEFVVHKYDELKDEIKRSAIERIHKSSHRVYKLLENLLEWAKLQTGGIKTKKNKINLHQIAEKNISLYDCNASKKEIVVKNDIGMNVSAYSDENMIDFVFRNLICNAIKFTEDGGQVNISTQDNEDFIEVSISDTGVGIAGENIKKLFRIDGGYTTPDTKGEKGTGLGLILCKEFVELNGGKIGVKSEVGKGSTFKFTLPKPL